MDGDLAWGRANGRILPQARSACQPSRLTARPATRLGWERMDERRLASDSGRSARFRSGSPAAADGAARGFLTGRATRAERAGGAARGVFPAEFVGHAAHQFSDEGSPDFRNEVFQAGSERLAVLLVRVNQTEASQDPKNGTVQGDRVASKGIERHPGDDKIAGSLIAEQLLGGLL